MKRILIILAMLTVTFPAIAFAANVTLAWNASTGQNVIGYKVFLRLDGGTYDYSSPDWQGQELTCTLSLSEGKYHAVARAFTQAAESADSNEADFEIISDLPPPPPQNLGVGLVQYIMNVFNRVE